jgi:hypothetical protein
VGPGQLALTRARTRARARVACVRACRHVHGREPLGAGRLAAPSTLQLPGAVTPSAPPLPPHPPSVPPPLHPPASRQDWEALAGMVSQRVLADMRRAHEEAREKGGAEVGGYPAGGGAGARLRGGRGEVLTGAATGVHP